MRVQGYYTGVGSRNITKKEAAFLEDVAYKLKEEGYVLRSGAAKGADDAFWQGVCRYYSDIELPNYDKRCERIYIPWDNFNGYTVDHPWGCFATPKTLGIEKFCNKVASEIHPAWDKCTRGARGMHARNVLQVLGDEGDKPSNFLIACSDPTPNGVAGGTNTAWQLAMKYDRPCFNIRVGPDKERLQEWLKC